MRDGLRLSSAVPEIQCDSNPYWPYGYKAMGNLYLFTPRTVLLETIFQCFSVV